MGTVSNSNENIDANKHLYSLEFNNYHDIIPYWIDLNQTYKSGELTLDWISHQLIWDHFHRPRGYQLYIVITMEDDRCTGIFPFTRSDSDPFGTPQWSFSDDLIVSREFFCPPEKIKQNLFFLPPHISDDLSCFYIPVDQTPFSRETGGLIDIKENQETYFQSLKKKARHNLKHTLQINSDIRVETNDRVHWEEIKEILKIQLNYWLTKNGAIDRSYYQYSRDKIYCTLMLMDRASEMGKLTALYFYLDKRLVAANFSVRREHDRIDDYLCLRDCREEHNWRGLGIYAILKNMEISRSLGIRYYDLSSCISEYKKKFINMESSYYYLDYNNPLNQFLDPTLVLPDTNDPSPVCKGF
ncbi:MAG: hypothetical protein JW755_07130 [Candidatus Aminicenantes bacterium]|nr:hypothetical protein [Candidatus Aminicenantes bacterium]